MPVNYSLSFKMFFSLTIQFYQIVTICFFLSGVWWQAGGTEWVFGVSHLDTGTALEQTAQLKL